MEVLQTDELCLASVTRLAYAARAIGVDSDASKLLAIAGIVSQALSGDGDFSQGVVVNAKTFNDITKQHLVQEYVQEKVGDMPSMRYRLTHCPHQTGVEQENTVPDPKKVVYH